MDVSSSEPLIRADQVGGPKANPLEEKVIYNSELEDVAEKSLEVRKALSKRMLRHQEGTKGGPVPVAWLTVACEKDLLRHIRLFPRYLGNLCFD